MSGRARSRKASERLGNSPCRQSLRLGSSDLSWNEWRNRFDTVRTVAIIAASLIGLSGVGAFASGVYHRRPSAVGDSGAHMPVIGAPPEKRDKTLVGDTAAVGAYCPIPPRGTQKGKVVMTPAGSAGDPLPLTGQSVVPDTATAQCTGTAAPEKRP